MGERLDELDLRLLEPIDPTARRRAPGGAEHFSRPCILTHVRVSYPRTGGGEHVFALGP